MEDVLSRDPIRILSSHLSAIIICILGLSLTASAVSPKLFQKEPGFSLQGHTLDTFNVKSLVKCSAICDTNSACFSFNFELASTTGISRCELVSCALDTNYSALVPNTNMAFYKQVIEDQVSEAPLCNGCIHSPCKNGGTCIPTGPLPSNFTCECPEDVSGETCELTFVEDCGNVPTYTGVATIKTTEGRIFNAYCEQGWTYVFKRFDGSENFDRDWLGFQQGFGDVNLEHFIGLDNLVSVLKQRSFKVRFDLTPWPSTLTPTEGYAEYTTFNLADESDKYRITISGYTGTAGDSMAYHNGQRFTTKDQDNDPYGSNCAVVYEGAWWHASCHYVNLFGIYEQTHTCRAFALCVCWQRYPGAGHNYSFKKAAMKIHRI